MAVGKFLDAENAEIAALTQQIGDLEGLLNQSKGDLALLLGSSLPPPAGTAADIASLGVSVSRGDWGGAFLDVIGLVPLVGDGVKGLVKGTKLADKIDNIRKAIAHGKKTLDAKIAKAKKNAEKRCKKVTDNKKKKNSDKDEALNCSTGNCGKKRLKQKEVPCFKKNKKGKPDEYDRQLKDQENGLNDLTAEEYLKGREAYKSTKRKSTTQTRKKYKKDLIKKHTDSGMSKADATKKAEGNMKTLHALHNPDLIAGGKDKTTTMGDKSVNQSIGSQWKKRVDDLDKEAKEAIKTHKGKSKMNVKLKRCK